MTTQHTHHEKSDVDTSVVEHSSTSETPTNSMPGENVAPAEDQNEAGPTSDEHTSSDPADEEEGAQQQAAPVASEEFPTVTPVASLEENSNDNHPEAVNESLPLETGEIQTAEDVVSTTIASPEKVHDATTETVVEVTESEIQTDSPEENADAAEAIEAVNIITKVEEEETIDVVAVSTQSTIEVVAPQSADEVTDLAARLAEVRPFTDFIEEFRQAEAARLRASQDEATLMLNSVVPTSSSTETEKITAPAISQEEAGQEGSPEKPGETMENLATSEQAKSSTKATQTERAVSPLLRPATRLRVPRHTSRQQREEQAAIQQQQLLAESNAEVVPSVTSPETAATPPKPARRYRFDRPGTKNNGTGSRSTPASTNEDGRHNGTVVGPVSGEVWKEATTEAIAQETATTETSGNNGQVASPPVTPEISTPSTSGRRKNASKEKEQQASTIPTNTQSTQAVNTPVPVEQPAEASVQPQEIAPEDLPPLEYSELRKVSSRRRRRRPGSAPASNAGATAPVPPVPPVLPAPITPTPAPQLPSTPPELPARPAANNNNNTNAAGYSIVSGYTLNQMNMGSELSGPFIGPEPSPARGSVFSRDGRTTQRAEAQRSVTSHGSVVHNRSSDGGLSQAALTQLTTAIAQGMQAQTDRMVTELRRLNQSPTNVSVSLPPFPSTERVGVFVDVANLLYSARTLRIAVDFGKLLDFLRGNRRLVRAQAYCPTSPQPGDEQMFLQAVKGLGYRITTKNYKTFSSGAKKADLDLDLCMDVVRLVDGKAVDCIVLVSGDSDFMPMLDYCSDHGVRVEVAAFDEAMSATLRQSCDLFINLSMLDDIRA